MRPTSIGRRDGSSIEWPHRHRAQAGTGLCWWPRSNRILQRNTQNPLNVPSILCTLKMRFDLLMSVYFTNLTTLAALPPSPSCGSQRSPSIVLSPARCRNHPRHHAVLSGVPLSFSVRRAAWWRGDRRRRTVHGLGHHSPDVWRVRVRGGQRARSGGCRHHQTAGPL